MPFGSKKKAAARNQALALDAADGVIDGRYFGAPVVPGRRGGPPTLAGPGRAPYFGAPAYGAPAFGAPAFASYPATTFAAPAAYPATTFGAPYYGATSSALALDAADGVIDGRHFGRPIVGGGVPSFAPTYPAGVSTFAPTTYGVPAFGASSSALALDAADGVIDGRHFGRPIVQSAPTFAPTFPAGFSTAFPTVAPTSSALALDAADGVIDGRHFGRPIVQSGFPATTAFPTSFPTGFPTTFTGFPSGFPTTVAPSSSALALDAADGVIDGRHFGRPIVQGGTFGAATYGTTFGAPTFGAVPFGTTFGAPTFGAPVTSAALAADAADGVIDGKYFGRPIVQA